jgi:hypothetical protein
MILLFNWLSVIIATRGVHSVPCSRFHSEILFSFALASASPTETAAAYFLPFLLGIMSIVNGIFVPHMQMTNPWRDFVYWANPVVSYSGTEIDAVYLFITPPGLILDLSVLVNHAIKFSLFMHFPTDYVGGFLGATLHGLPVECKPVDLAFFNPPPSQTCVAYAGEWVVSSGGYLTNPNATANCE